jgi:hypothetical protein
MDSLRKEIVGIFINFFLFMCKLSNKLNEKFNDIYTKNIHLQTAYYYITYIYCFLTCRKIEPSTCPWISKSWIVYNHKSITDRYLFFEDYKINFNEIFVCLFKTTTSLYEMLNGYFKHFCTSNDIIHYTTLFIFKVLNEENDECYFVYKGNKPIPTISFEKSNASFLSIEYKHPEMEKSIEITLDDRWYYVGNELFTPTFVLRALKYQSKPFFFDMNYKISIVDKHIHLFHFGCNNYVLLTKNGYELVENNSYNLNDKSLIEENDEKLEEEIDAVETDDQLLWKEQFELCGQFLNDIS